MEQGHRNKLRASAIDYGRSLKGIETYKRVRKLMFLKFFPREHYYSTRPKNSLDYADVDVICRHLEPEF